MKQIPLSQGKFAVVDDEDFEILNQHKWSALKCKNKFYAKRRLTLPGGNQKTILMHRVIIGLADTKILCDHRDGNGLNNQKHNLRACSHSENLSNRGANSNNTSGHKGVSWNKYCKKWEAYIKKDGKKKNLGLFADIQDAARAYDAAAKIYFGEFAGPVNI